MSDSRGIAADDEEINDTPQKRIKVPPPKKAPPIKKQFTDASKKEESTQQSTAAEKDDPWKRENSQAPRRVKDNPLKRMFGPATSDEQFRAY